jgi:hypothetical protein
MGKSPQIFCSEKKIKKLTDSYLNIQKGKAGSSV